MFAVFIIETMPDAAALRSYFESPEFINDLGLLDFLKSAKDTGAKKRIFSTFTQTVYYYIENGDDGDMGIIGGRLETNLDALRKCKEEDKLMLIGVISEHFRILAKAQGIEASSEKKTSSSPKKKTKSRSHRRSRARSTRRH
jgi:hypothetical protein